MSIGEPLNGHDDYITSVAFSPTRTLLVSGSQDKTIRLRDTAIGSPIGPPLTGHEGFVTSLVLASFSYDNTIRIWNAVTGAAIGTPLPGHTGSVVLHYPLTAQGLHRARVTRQFGYVVCQWQTASRTFRGYYLSCIP